jgi:hypothetical protein
MDNWALATVLLAGFATLAIYSFLIRENRVYRFFEHLFIGIASGMGLVYGVRDFLLPKVFEPLFGSGRFVFPDGTQDPYDTRWLLLLIPMMFGMLYYTIFSRRFSWLAKLVIGFSLGMSGGIAFKGTVNDILPQLVDSFRPLVVFGAADKGGHFLWWASLENCIFVFTLLAVMLYFFFSYKWTSATRVSRGIAHGGRLLLMVCFGAFFGSTVMARMALLVERFQFLLGDWKDAVAQILF